MFLSFAGRCWQALAARSSQLRLDNDKGELHALVALCQSAQCCRRSCMQQVPPVALQLWRRAFTELGKLDQDHLVRVSWLPSSDQFIYAPLWLQSWLADT